MTEGDLLKLKGQLEARHQRLVARMPVPETLSGKKAPREPSDVEFVLQALAQLADHLADLEVKRRKGPVL